MPDDPLKVVREKAIQRLRDLPPEALSDADQVWASVRRWCVDHDRRSDDPGFLAGWEMATRVIVALIVGNENIDDYMNGEQVRYVLDEIELTNMLPYLPNVGEDAIGPQTKGLEDAPE